MEDQVQNKDEDIEIIDIDSADSGPEDDEIQVCTQESCLKLIDDLKNQYPVAYHFISTLEGAPKPDLTSL